MFPIGIMFYFGTNLDRKFSVPDFWPKPNQLHKIPTETHEIDAELERLKARRLALRQRRLQAEAQEEANEQAPMQSQLHAVQVAPKDTSTQSQLGGRSWGQYLGGWWDKKE